MRKPKTTAILKKEPKEARWQTHVYLNEGDFLRLKAIADKESRSTTMQIEYFLRKAIANYRDKEIG